MRDRGRQVRTAVISARIAGKSIADLYSAAACNIGMPNNNRTLPQSRNRLRNFPCRARMIPSLNRPVEQGPLLVGVISGDLPAAFGPGAFADKNVRIERWGRSHRKDFPVI